MCVPLSVTERGNISSRRREGAQILTEEYVALNGFSSSINMTFLMN